MRHNFATPATTTGLTETPDKSHRESSAARIAPLNNRDFKKKSYHAAVEIERLSANLDRAGMLHLIGRSNPICEAMRYDGPYLDNNNCETESLRQLNRGGIA
jgi:hypothetical protein